MVNLLSKMHHFNFLFFQENGKYLETFETKIKLVNKTMKSVPEQRCQMDFKVGLLKYF